MRDEKTLVTQTYAKVIRVLEVWFFVPHQVPYTFTRIWKGHLIHSKNYLSRLLLKGLRPHPLLRNSVKQDFEEVFPDDPEEIFWPVVR